MSTRQKLKLLFRPVYSRADKILYKYRLKDVSKLTLPNFFVIGAMKAGTTWIYENLRCHPDIFLPDRKEDYFFSFNFYKRSLHAYSRRFLTEKQYIKGEITPGYSILPLDRIRFIHTIAPHCKLIFIVRNPIERSWSEAYMNLVSKPKSSIDQIKTEEFMAYFNSDGCIKRSNYLEILNNWLTFFPRKQMYIGSFDDVEHNPKKLLSDIFNLLNVPDIQSWNDFPFDKIIVPKYESHGGVHGGIISEDGVSPSKIPDHLHHYLKQKYSDQIRITHEKYGTPLWETSR